MFWGWFALTLVMTVGCFGGNRALPELALAVLLLLMSLIWTVRVALSDGRLDLGPRTAHLLAVGLLLWTAASLVPLPAETAARLSDWSAWGLELNREAGEATGLEMQPSAVTFSIDPAASRRDLRRLGCYYLLFLLLMAHLSRWRDLRIMLGIVMSVAVAEALVGGAGILSGTRQYLWLLPNPVSEYHRHFGTFVNANHAGTLLGVGLMLLLPLALLPAAIGRRRAVDHRGWRIADCGLGPIVFGLAGATLAVGLILTNSHGALLAAGVPLVVLLTLFAVRYPRARTRLALAGVATLAVGLAAYGFLPGHERTLQANKIADRRQHLAEGRPLFRRKIWEGVMAAGAVAPWTGSGPGSFIDAYRPFDRTRKETLINSAHSTYLDVLVERGLIGSALAALGLGWLVCLIRTRSAKPGGCYGRALRRSRAACLRDMFRMGLGGAVAVVVLHAITDFPLQIPAIALALVAVIAAAVRSSPGHKPLRIIGRRRLLVPLATVTAGVVLVVSSTRPLLASVQLGRTIRLGQLIESQLADGREPARDSRARLVESATALHRLTSHDSRGAAYGLKTRMLTLDRPSRGLQPARTLAHDEACGSLLRDATEMLRANPFCIEARLAAATAAAHLGNVRAAAILAHQAQRLDGGHAKTQYAAGRALMAAGAERRGLCAFARSLNTSPRYVYDIARDVRARRLEQQILDLGINEPRSLCWLASNLPGVDAATKERVAARLDAMLASREHDLTRAERLYLHGQSALWLRNRPERAARYFEQSLAIEPLVWIRWHLARAYSRAGRPVDAAAELEAIHRLDPAYTPPEKLLRQGEPGGDTDAGSR